MTRRQWDSAKRRQQVGADIRAEVAARSHTREIYESRRQARDPTHAPQPSKAQMRAEASAAAAAWQSSHPAPAPWGPWSPWRTVTRGDGTTYQEHDRRRL